MSFAFPNFPGTGHRILGARTTTGGTSVAKRDDEPHTPALAQTVSEQEYSRFFERNRLGLVSSTEYRSNGDWEQTAAQYGMKYDLARQNGRQMKAQQRHVLC